MAEDSEYVLEPLREGADFTLYRGRERGNQTPILAVVVAAEQPSPQILRRLEHEYSLASELDAAWAAQPLALTRRRGRAVLILRDPGGEPLDRVIEQHKGQDLTRFLRIAIGLATALGQVHRQGLIHKDVKPANALVDASCHVWLTGFGFASRLLRERLTPTPPEIIAGSLPYMAPEQTGRMNRSIDSRSDLYSLGVTLYEMSTGKLPFTASDPMELVHSQIARQPVSPRDLARNIPGVVSAIIMKLLTKTAEERYQTAVGLQRDLQRCLQQSETHRRIDEFPLGEYDKPGRLLIPEKLYGREREVDALLTAFDRVVAQGTAELVLVSGYSGVGKSSVVNELHKVLVPPRGLFAAGKFDQYKRDIPYTTLAQAFQMLVREVLVKSEAEVRRWRQALLEALGPNGQLIVNLIPEVEFVIGKQPPVADLPPREARNRFQLVFSRFLGAFARPEHPLALFLDDLQWLDTATLELLESLITDPDVRHVLLIGAYRDNEVGSSHPLIRTLAAIRDAGARVQEIVLTPLGLDDIERLIVDAMHRGLTSAGPLALLVYEKTAGNPFFAIQLLTSLVDEGLLRFDGNAAVWICDLDQIRAKGYSDNVVDLMVGKLLRLSGRTQTALKQLACLGNVAAIATLGMVFGQPEEEIHAALLEPVRAGLIIRLEGSYAFLHDRIQEAAYALIPESERAQAHLRIGRLLAAHTPAEKREEIIFDIVNQLNRSVASITSNAERSDLAEFNLIAGKRAKTSTAYVSALRYLVAGAELLSDDEWECLPNLKFALELHRAECEFLTGELTAADARLTTLSSRAANTVDMATVACLRIELYLTLGRTDQAVDVCLTYLRHLGIELSPHPTEAEARREYERTLSLLGQREIEELIDLPSMSEPESAATLDVLMKVLAPVLLWDPNLLSLLICRIVNLSMEYGNTDSSCYGYVWLAAVAGPRFGDYQAGYRFGQLGHDLVESRGSKRFEAGTYLGFGVFVLSWTTDLRTAEQLIRRAFSSASAVGDLTNAGHCCTDLIGILLGTGDSLAQVERDAEQGLEFVRKLGFGFVIGCINIQLAFIHTLRGSTATFGYLCSAHFDEREWEQRLSSDSRLEIAACWYWIRKLQARFFAGDYPAAVEASANAQRLLWTSTGFFETAEAHFYGALSHTASCDAASSAEYEHHLKAAIAHRKQLAEWAENCPRNFQNRAALVGAEIARVEGRDLEAERLYEAAIHSARENGFVQNEGLAHELAAQYYLARGIETAGYAHLRNARNCYDRWGAHGKVNQLDARYARLREERPPASAAAIGEPAGQLDVETVVKASQALSSEMVLPKLIKRLMRIAVEHAGAERGLLILTRDGEPRIEAEATTGDGRVEVAVRQAVVTPSDLPQSALHYVIRTHEGVLLGDASADNVYSRDEYVLRKRSRSVLCLPIVKQTKLVGALYLENNLTPLAFTPDRVTVLQLLASQAAISLENASLYSDLQRSEAFLAQGQRISQTGSFGWSVSSAELYWSEEIYSILECNRAAKPTLDLIFQRVHPDDRNFVRQTLDHATREKTDFDIEHRLLMPDGRVKHVHIIGRAVNTGDLDFVGAARDITESTRAEEALRQAQDDLARVNRVTTMGELAASLAHELSQPISGTMTNASTCLRSLERDTPDLEALRRNVIRIARDAQRASDVIDRIRSQFKKGAPHREAVDVNEINRDTVALLRDEAARYNISVRTELAADLPQIVGDRVQLQQVAMNLIVNGIEAMKGVDGIREMVIKSQRTENEQILVSVTDTGIGFPPQLAEQIFDPFFSTKPHGTGMGLRISRSIIESHRGRLWAVSTPGCGATFHLSLPATRKGQQSPDQQAMPK